MDKAGHAKAGHGLAGSLNHAGHVKLKAAILDDPGPCDRLSRFKNLKIVSVFTYKIAKKQ